MVMDKAWADIDAGKEFHWALRACLVRDRVGPGGAKSAAPMGMTGNSWDVFCGAASSVLEAHLAKRAIDESSAYASACKTV
jgi:hypothetical protein